MERKLTEPEIKAGATRFSPEQKMVIERLARAWASIDGKAERFDAGKKDPELMSQDGTFEGYIAETEELCKRAKLWDLVTLKPNAQN